jgi:uncharacterized protein YdaU (DUF1376 family)
MKLNGLMWWVDRWRKSTAYTDMTLEQQAAYRNLLDECTLRGGPIPNDERILGKACGDPKRWPKLRGMVMKRFTLSADGWRNETLDEVLKTTAKRMQKQRQNASQNRGNGAGT